MFNKLGLTLIEVIVVIIILGALAAFTIPCYTALGEQAAIQTAKNNLVTIAYAEKNYYFTNGAYYFSTNGSTNDLMGIDTALSLNIQDNGFYDYFCSVPTIL